MDDEIRLGYQAGVVSLRSPTYGRLWLSVEHRAGDTVSCMQAEALVLAAEKRTGLHPWRCTELLRGRIEISFLRLLIRKIISYALKNPQLVGGLSKSGVSL